MTGQQKDWMEAGWAARRTASAARTAQYQTLTRNEGVPRKAAARQLGICYATTTTYEVRIRVMENRAAPPRRNRGDYQARILAVLATVPDAGWTSGAVARAMDDPVGRRFIAGILHDLADAGTITRQQVRYGTRIPWWEFSHQRV